MPPKLRVRAANAQVAPVAPPPEPGPPPPAPPPPGPVDQLAAVTALLQEAQSTRQALEKMAETLKALAESQRAPSAQLPPVPVLAPPAVAATGAAPGERLPGLSALLAPAATNDAAGSNAGLASAAATSVAVAVEQAPPAQVACGLAGGAAQATLPSAGQDKGAPLFTQVLSAAATMPAMVTIAAVTDVSTLPIASTEKLFGVFWVTSTLHEPQGTLLHSLKSIGELSAESVYCQGPALAVGHQMIAGLYDRVSAGRCLWTKQANSSTSGNHFRLHNDHCLAWFFRTINPSPCVFSDYDRTLTVMPIGTLYFGDCALTGLLARLLHNNSFDNPKVGVPPQHAQFAQHRMDAIVAVFGRRTVETITAFAAATHQQQQGIGLLLTPTNGTDTRDATTDYARVRACLLELIMWVLCVRSGSTPSATIRWDNVHTFSKFLTLPPEGVHDVLTATETSAKILENIKHCADQPHAMDSAVNIKFLQLWSAHTVSYAKEFHVQTGVDLSSMHDSTSGRLSAPAHRAHTNESLTFALLIERLNATGSQCASTVTTASTPRTPTPAFPAAVAMAHQSLTTCTWCGMHHRADSACPRCHRVGNMWSQQGRGRIRSRSWDNGEAALMPALGSAGGGTPQPPQQQRQPPPMNRQQQQPASSLTPQPVASVQSAAPTVQVPTKPQADASRGHHGSKKRVE